MKTPGLSNQSACGPWTRAKFLSYWSFQRRDKGQSHTALSQMGVQASSGQPLSKENCFIFHMLLYKLLIWAGPITHFGQALLNFWLNAWSPNTLVQVSNVHMGTAFISVLSTTLEKLLPNWFWSPLQVLQVLLVFQVRLVCRESLEVL